MCGEEIETSLHLFNKCHGIKVMAFTSRWGCLLDNWNATSIEEIINWCIDPNSRPSMQESEEELVTVFLCTLLYCFWNYRNTVMFGKPEAMDCLVQKFSSMVEEMLEVHGRESIQWLVNVTVNDSKRGEMDTPSRWLDQSKYGCGMQVKESSFGVNC